jgi:glycerol-3-phosphate acyltransferase PlsY
MFFAYLLGSIPSAVWVGKFFFGTDVREHGSGNSGATNTFRVLGKRAGIPVLILDSAKGFGAVMLAYLISQVPPGTPDFVNTELVLGTSAVLGHIFPVFAGFRGGKGVATLLGVTLALNPITSLVCIGIFFLFFLGTHYVSLSSISAGVSYPIVLIVLFGHHTVPSHIIFAVMVAILTLITHQKNLERLLSRTESKMFLIKRKQEEDETSEEGALS